ncbi:unnamed protein product [Pieris macdunnoughi]|uniref:Uncharacterized protein n=1 Tax=Pieris macdunnoughi TaxID=345717 RepID=A0A821S3V0_9NEOP|nr:unnamed protein product [Pieris macdunnoughi]
MMRRHILIYIITPFPPFFLEPFKQSLHGTVVKEYFIPSSLRKIDWHDYKKIKYERKQKGIGEQGIPAYLSKNEEALEKVLYSVNGFNGALSDKIPLNQSLPDIRHIKCQKRLYIESLPTLLVFLIGHPSS